MSSAAVVPPADPAPLRRALLVWGIGLAVYLLAIFHRTSLAVAGLEATDRFGITASQLATFTMLQLLVYAGMQVPVGLLVDRFGPRAVMLTGVVVLSAAQVGFALAESYGVALVARTFVGMGDAMTWICLLRLVNRWFGPRRVPVATQLSGVIGQLGAIAAAAPMTWALGTVGWTTAYLVTASLGLLVGLGVLLGVRDSPAARTVRGDALSLGRVRSLLASAWSHPGTRLGFWSHFVTQFSATTMALLWGYPFFVQGEHRTPAQANLLLTLIVVAFMYSGPVLGRLVARHPWHRSSMVLVIVSAIVTVWTAVLLWPGDAPLWLLVLLTQVVGVGGPASLIGFDLARTSNPGERQGSASGLVNQGGFVASLVLVSAIGLILDWRTPAGSTDYDASAFRWAMSFQYVLWGLGLTQVYRLRRRTRRYLTDLALRGGVEGNAVPGAQERAQDRG
ncbi:MFS transporter [Nocardioides bruguierae]|uniref:MFS transporter n=1 Tax=Nocardioides bruguierae TaxID=2945102 RepID=UPI00202187AC|nr:MFS transporter [Nocardioides bruguierae]MCL8024395.1 MFS transporter [Nocardioides bruguierae]